MASKTKPDLVIVILLSNLLTIAFREDITLFDFHLKKIPKLSNKYECREDMFRYVRIQKICFPVLSLRTIRTCSSEGKKK